MTVGPSRKKKWWIDRHTIDILVPKGRNWKGEKGDRSQKIQIKLSKANYIWCSGWRITFLVLMFCPPEPLGWEHNPAAVASTLPLQLWTEAPSIQLFGVNCPWATGQWSLAGQSEEETAAGPWWERKPGWSLSYPLHPSLFLEDKACWQPACSVALCCSLWSDLAVLLLISSHPYSRRLLRWFTCTVYLSDDFSVHILEHIPPLFFFSKFIDWEFSKSLNSGTSLLSANFFTLSPLLTFYSKKSGVSRLHLWHFS